MITSSTATHMRLTQMTNWTNVSADKFTTPLERDAAKLAGLSISEFRKLHGNTRNMWKQQAFKNFKAAQKGQS